MEPFWNLEDGRLLELEAVVYARNPRFLSLGMEGIGGAVH